LDHASGVFPTMKGEVKVDLKRDGNGFSAHVQGPAGVELIMTSAPGIIHQSGDTKANAAGYAQARYVWASHD
jgi:hypothetical protein